VSDYDAAVLRGAALMEAYAELAVTWYGYTPEAVDEVQQENIRMDTAQEVA